MIIRGNRPFANDHPEGPASCKSTIESNSQSVGLVPVLSIINYVNLFQVLQIFFKVSSFSMAF